MPTPIHELENMRSRRAELVTQMRAILDTARGESRELNAEETQNYDRLEHDFQSLHGQIEREESLAATEGRLERRVIVNPVASEEDGEDEGFWALFDSPDYSVAFTDYMRRTANGMSPDNRAVLDRVQR